MKMIAFLLIFVLIQLSLAVDNMQTIEADSIRVVNAKGLTEHPNPMWLESDESHGVVFMSFRMPSEGCEGLQSLVLELKSADQTDAESMTGFAVFLRGRHRGGLAQVERNQTLSLPLDLNDLDFDKAFDLVLVPGGPDGVGLLPQARLVMIFAPVVQLNRGLIAEYRFDGDFQDSSENEHHGQKVGTCSFTKDRFGRENLALLMTGAKGSYVSVNHTEALNPEQISLSAWITGNSPQLWARVLNKYHHSRKLGYAMIFNHTSGTIAMDAFSQSKSSIWAQTESKLSSQWQHVVYTYDGQEICSYYNGMLETSQPISGQLGHTNSPLTLGNGHDGNSYFPWKGALDDVRIYNRALSAAEVEALFKQTPAKESNNTVIDLRNVDTF